MLLSLLLICEDAEIFLKEKRVEKLVSQQQQKKISSLPFHNVVFVCKKIYVIAF